MTEADWRALIEAFLDDRLSAEAFARRFLEAWGASRRAGRAVPPDIARLQLAVESFAAEAEGKDEGAADSDSLREAARRARTQLGETTAQPQTPFAAGPTYDRTRAREDMRRFQLQVSGCAGVGCFIGMAWAALCLLQVYYVSEQIQLFLGWGVLPSAALGLVLAFVPIIGNVLAFLGATAEGWPVWLAAIVFFAAPAATLISGWSRWRRYRK